MNVHIFVLELLNLCSLASACRLFNASEIIVLFFVFLFKEIFRFLSFDE